MFDGMYPLWSFVTAVIVAQISKPFWELLTEKRFRPQLIFASGGMPSSHTAGVAALCLSIGFQESFVSPLFSVTLALGLIVSYDAANVRYYAGKNIQLTKQVIKDLKKKHDIELDHPIYNETLKEVLGHKWSEVISGAVIGLLTAFLVHVMIL